MYSQPTFVCIYIYSHKIWDGKDCVIFCERAHRENKNCHAISYVEGCCLFAFKGLVMAATEEERDGRHQELAMATMGEWRTA